MTLVDRSKRTEIHSVIPKTTIVTGAARTTTRAVVAAAHAHLVRLGNLDH
jgi:hypothetical protein